tara:strand:+ start:4439 stop:5788 length:1350 start_codon:yes stop_codon:yes gene_type:complete
MMEDVASKLASEYGIEDKSMSFEDAVFIKVGSVYTYRIDFNSHTIEARVRVLQSGTDRIQGEVDVAVDGNRMHRSNPMLTSVSGMDSYSKKLEKRMPKVNWGIDWEIYIEELAGRVIDAHRKGQPMVHLSNVKPESETQWLVEPLVLENRANIIFGPGGSGKSYLACLLAVLLDTGHVDTSHGLSVTQEKQRVLYLDWETYPTEISSRVRDVEEGLGIPGKSDIMYRRCTQSLAAEIDTIKDMVDRNKITFVICDSLSFATMGELRDEKAVGAYFNSLAELQVSSLTLTHVNKEGGLFGSAYIFNSGRNIWEITKSDEEDKGKLEVGLWHRKFNDIAKQAPRAFRIEFEDKAVMITAQDPIDSDVVSSGLSYGVMIEKIVQRNQPIDRIKIIEMVAQYKELPIEDSKLKRNISTAMSRLVKNNKIAEDSNGLYTTQIPLEALGEDEFII